jgi:hypothetical protein
MLSQLKKLAASTNNSSRSYAQLLQHYQSAWLGWIDGSVVAAMTMRHLDRLLISRLTRGQEGRSATTGKTPTVRL